MVTRAALAVAILLVGCSWWRADPARPGSVEPYRRDLDAAIYEARNQEAALWDEFYNAEEIREETDFNAGWRSRLLGPDWGREGEQK